MSRPIPVMIVSGLRLVVPPPTQCGPQEIPLEGVAVEADRAVRSSLRRRQFLFDRNDEAGIGWLDGRAEGCGEGAVTSHEVFVEVPAR